MRRCTVDTSNSRVACYGIEESLIRRNVYFSAAHGEYERETNEVREKTLKVLRGEIVFSVNIELAAQDEKGNPRLKELQ